MEFKTIIYEIRERVAILYLNRPETLNALNLEMRDEVGEVISKAGEDEGVRALIITGKGKAFCAGADLSVFKKDFEKYEKTGEPSGFYDVEVPKRFASFPKPLIASVNGPAVGVGMTMALACDIVLASVEATFSAPFVRIGLSPEFGSSYHLPRRVGYARAAEWFFLGKTISAEEAYQYGLVNQVTTSENLFTEAYKIAISIASMPQEAILATKRLLRLGEESRFVETLDREAEVFQRLQRTRDHYKTVCEFLNSVGSRH